MSQTETSPEYTTPAGIEIRRFYGPGAEGDDARDTRDRKFYDERLGQAGKVPMTRGVHETMYRGRLWTMRQYSGFGTASESNKRFRFLLDSGQTGLSTAFDLPTQIGYDADHEKAHGEVGRVGVHIGSLDDMETLFDQIPLEQVSTSMTINATAQILLALYVAVAKRQGADPAALRGTVQNDILKEYLARGTYIYPVEHGMRLSVDLIEHSVRHFPKWNPISISGYHIREAGADAVQEVAFTLGNAEAYLKALTERGIPVDDFAPRLAFFWGVHNHFLEEIAKFRAARRLWSRILSEDFGAANPKSKRLRFHAQTCGSTLTSQQPLNNVTRVSLQAMAAVLGGCQSLHTNSFDEAIALPTEESAQLALRTQQILAHETGVPDTVDPVGGSYAIERLTDEIEERAYALIGKVREMGGMIPAIQKGWAQKEIQDSAYRYQRDVEAGRRKVVGVNCYEAGNETEGGDDTRYLKVSPKLEDQQRGLLKAFRGDRDRNAADAALSALKDAAKDPGRNIFPSILAAVEAKATLGEISDSLREIFGEYRGN